MLTELKRANQNLDAALAGFDPELVSSAQAAEIYDQAARLVRRGEAIMVLAASRTAESQLWKENGHRSAAEWMASAAGVGVGEALSHLETASRLGWLPATEDALRRGELSSPQVKEITAAALHRPRAEAELLQAAGAGSFKGLKERCRRVLAETSSAEEDAERLRKVHERRSFRAWSEPDGALRGEFTLTPDDGGRLLSALERRANELFDLARTEGRHEPAAAYRADALVDLVTGNGAPTAPTTTRRERVDMVVVVDAAALRRGHGRAAELCEIRGVGPVPVTVARALIPDAWVKVVVRDGVDIRTVCHLGRTINAVLRTALEVRDPTCAVPGCDTAIGLEIDHVTEVARGGTTELANLCRLCHHHHYLKTTHQFFLSGGPGNWVWEPAVQASGPDPDGTDLDRHTANGHTGNGHHANGEHGTGRAAPAHPEEPGKRSRRRSRGEPAATGASAGRGSTTLFDSS